MLENGFSTDSRKDELYEDLFRFIEAEFGSDQLSRYRDHPIAFVEEVLHADPKPEQREMLTALQTKRHVTVRSGHGIGKSSGMAMAVWWFVCTRSHARVPVTAPTSHQLFDVLWAELSKWYQQMDERYKKYFEVMSDKVVHRQYQKTWFAAARTARPENPEALQGFHGENLLFLIDEAAGVHNSIFEVSEGSLTTPESMCLMAGNPTKLSGFFYDSFHSDAERWTQLHFSSEDSQLVDPGYCERMAKKYGRESNVYRIRVLGEFPTSEEDSLISLDILSDAANRWHVEPAGDAVWGVDVARYGDDATALARRQGDVITSVEVIRNQNTMEVAGWVINRFHDCDARARPQAICVDVIGLGAGVVDRLEELHYPVFAINVSEKAELSNQYHNLRAELWCRFADWLQNRRVKIPLDKVLMAEASNIRYSFDSRGRIKVEKKQDMKKRGLQSPDRADAVCLTFGSHYLDPAENADFWKTLPTHANDDDYVWI